MSHVPMHRVGQEAKNDREKRETRRQIVQGGDRVGYGNLQQTVNPVLAHMHQGFQTPVCIKLRHLLTLLCGPSHPNLSLNSLCSRTYPNQLPALRQQPCNLKCPQLQLFYHAPLRQLLLLLQRTAILVTAVDFVKYMCWYSVRHIIDILTH